MSTQADNVSFLFKNSLAQNHNTDNRRQDSASLTQQSFSAMLNSRADIQPGIPDRPGQPSAVQNYPSSQAGGNKTFENAASGQNNTGRPANNNHNDHSTPDTRPPQHDKAQTGSDAKSAAEGAVDQNAIKQAQTESSATDALADAPPSSTAQSDATDAQQDSTAVDNALLQAIIAYLQSHPQLTGAANPAASPAAIFAALQAVAENTPELLLANGTTEESVNSASDILAGLLGEENSKQSGKTPQNTLPASLSQTTTPVDTDSDLADAVLSELAQPQDNASAKTLFIKLTAITQQTTEPNGAQMRAFSAHGFTAGNTATDPHQMDIPPGSLQAMGFNPGLRAQTPALQLQMTTPAGQSQWAEEMGSRIVWMVNKHESKAELVLTPPNLGKIGVSIHSNGDQTSAHFITATQAARDALEQALPRLRELMQQAGIQLGQTNVSTSGEQQAHDNTDNPHFQWHHAEADEQDVASVPLSQSATHYWVRTDSGAVDLFA